MKRPVRFVADLVLEGEPTVDGRVVAAGGTTWQTPPLPVLAAVEIDPIYGYWQAVPAGTIERVWRDQRNRVACSGQIDTANAPRWVWWRLRFGRVRLAADCLVGSPDPVLTDGGMLFLPGVRISAATVVKTGHQAFERASFYVTRR